MLSIGIGSKTSTGGVVIEGNVGIMFDGLVASSVGHKATCPACKKGMGKIVAVGARATYLPAGPAARAGDYIACGCPPGANTLVAQGTISIDSRSKDAGFKATSLIKQAPSKPRAHLGSGVTPNNNALMAARSGAQSGSGVADSTDQTTALSNAEKENPAVELATVAAGWRLLGSIDAGGGRVEKTMAVDAGQELKLQAHSNTLGLEGFHVNVTPKPLNEHGQLADTADALKVIIPPMGRLNGIYQLLDDGSMARSFTAGFGTGMALEFQAPYTNSSGFRWLIRIPPQEQIHQNSAGYRIDIYAR